MNSAGRHYDTRSHQIPSWLVKLIVAGIIAASSGVAGVLIRHERAIATFESNAAAIEKLERRFDRFETKLDRVISGTRR